LATIEYNNNDSMKILLDNSKFPFKVECIRNPWNGDDVLSKFDDIKKWCRKNFGKSALISKGVTGDRYEYNTDGKWQIWFFDNLTVFFKNEEDALLFKLTWG